MDQPLPLTEHLAEIRRRLLWCLAAVILAAVAASFRTDELLHQLTRVTGPLVFLRPTEAFLAKVKLSLILGVFVAAPVILYHAWRFIGVALTVNERRVMWGALPFSFILFALGAGLGWFFVVPAGLRFLVDFHSLEIRPTLSVESTLSFALWTCLGLGLLFQLPVVLAALGHWGILRADGLRRYRRHIVLGILILSAVLTPSPDVFSQMLLALPTYLLFELSILLVRFLQTK
jgi:sec-independent protein translocase protein TatC